MKAAVALLATVMCQPVSAVERIRVRAASLSTPTIAATDIDLRLDLLASGTTQLDLRAAALSLPSNIERHSGAVTALHVQCRNPVIREPQFGCPAWQLDARAARWPPLHLAGKAGLDSAQRTLVASGSGMNVAGSNVQFDVAMREQGWRAQLELPAFRLPEMKTLLAARITVPGDVEVSGSGALKLIAESDDSGMHTSVDLVVTDGGFQNAAYTWAGEKLAFDIHATADLSRDPYPFEVKINGTQGQALAGAVLLDFTANPMNLRLTGLTNGAGVEITRLEGAQKNLAQLSGTAALVLQPLAIATADITVAEFTFPAAYSSYLQLPLATTSFNQLVTRGGGAAHVIVENNAPRSVDLTLRDLDFSDDKRGLQVVGVNSDLHWKAGGSPPVQPSWLAWQSARGWKIVGAQTRLDFTASDRDFRLLQPARLPFFDGALRINAFAVERIGQPDMAGVFDAVIEPISVGPIAKALDWPEFSGQLAGKIPGLTYKDHLLTLQGNLDATVFDGRVVATNLRVRDPLGAWPRLYADITARNLDLDLITRTFEFGSITGRIDVDVDSLETFNWSPVAFDLKIATPRGDQSRHRISQRAVQNISNIGGGGGGVSAALQSGALQFFDEFGYGRIGLSCVLRNDVCRMAGLGKMDGGFVIIKGKGLPGISIIGNNERVDWPVLMRQVADAVRNPEGINVR